MADDVVDEVRLVAHQDHRRARRIGDGEVQVRRARSRVVGAAQPEVVRAALDGNVAVDEHGRAVRYERGDDVPRADPNVVVPQARIPLRRLEPLQHLGRKSRRTPGVLVRRRSAADEVASEEDKLGIELVDDVNGMLKKPGLGVLLEVNVGELNESEPDEGIRQVADPEGPLGDLDLVARVGVAVGGKAQPGGRGPDEETAARNGPRAKLMISREDERAYSIIPRVRRWMANVRL